MQRRAGAGWTGPVVFYQHQAWVLEKPQSSARVLGDHIILSRNSITASCISQPETAKGQRRLHLSASRVAHSVQHGGGPCICSASTPRPKRRDVMKRMVEIRDQEVLEGYREGCADAHSREYLDEGHLTVDDLKAAVERNTGLKVSMRKPSAPPKFTSKLVHPAPAQPNPAKAALGAAKKSPVKNASKKPIPAVKADLPHLKSGATAPTTALQAMKTAFKV
ncbi:hypothetical protein [Ralstonia phage phiRSL1]|uniref:Uncharacterized protein n=1 Tax=Ralstonia phage phiRSL1 TaxID=1980924 RepID=B2ZYJ8_9CAUD|nr:hypothetical protein RSL1_ORF327 [Ralstonia phage phiRSL1]BAG41774.2 hypothetical protein [Ralstonia phage phiRSL1]